MTHANIEEQLKPLVEHESDLCDTDEYQFVPCAKLVVKDGDTKKHEYPCGHVKTNNKLVITTMAIRITNDLIVHVESALFLPVYHFCGFYRRKHYVFKENPDLGMPEQVNLMKFVFEKVLPAVEPSLFGNVNPADGFEMETT